MANDIDVHVLKVVRQLRQAYGVDHEDAIQAQGGVARVAHPRYIVRIVVVSSKRLPAVPAQVLATCRAIDAVAMHRGRSAPSLREKGPTAPGQVPELVVFCVSLWEGVLWQGAKLAHGDAAAAAQLRRSVTRVAKREQAKAALLFFRIVLAVRGDANKLPRC